MIAGILAASCGGDDLTCLVAIAAYIGVVALTRSTEGGWFMHLCAGCLVAVAAGLSSPLWAIIVMLLALGCAGAELDLFAMGGEKGAYLLFSVLVLVLTLILTTGIRHAVLPLAVFALVFLIGMGVVAIAWARTVWKAQIGDI